MKKILVTLFTLSLSLSTIAQVNTSSANDSSIFKNLEESNFKLLYLNSTYTATDGAKRDGFTMDHLFYFRYNITSNQNIRWVPVITQTFGKADQDQNGTTYGGSSVRYYLNNILTEEKNGISLSFQNRNYILDGEDRIGAGYDSAHRFYFTGSKQITDRFHTEFGAYSQVYNKNGSQSDAIELRHYAGIFGFYSFNSNWSLGTALEWVSSDYTEGQNQEVLAVTLPYVRYNKGKAFAELYAIYDIGKSGDNQFLSASGDIFDSGTVFLDIGYSLF